MEAAMRRMAKEGMLISQGVGRRRRIVLPAGKTIRPHFKVSVLLYESSDRYSPLQMGLLDELNKNGFTAKFAAKSLLDLGMDAKKVSRFVRGAPSDAWIVMAGKHEVLEWFSNESVPVFGFYGGWSRLPIAGIGVRKDIRPVIMQLADLGHRRIVLLARGTGANPERHYFIRNFMDSLRSEGIDAGSYNLPVFGYLPEDLHRCLDSLFKANRPTAIFVSEVHIMLAVRDYLARRGIIAPRDVSLICFDHDLSFAWCNPVVSHYTWDPQSMHRRVVRWTKNVAHGKDDRRQIFIMGNFVEGGTIGPAPQDPAGDPALCFATVSDIR
jgi:DNA-binding LacI/PurR family transcriptional regulator